jgi:hypothetical protein
LCRPRTERRQPQTVALGQAAKQRFIRQNCALDLPSMVRTCRNAPLLLQRATNAAASHSSILGLHSLPKKLKELNESPSVVAKWCSFYSLPWRIVDLRGIRCASGRDRTVDEVIE